MATDYWPDEEGCIWEGCVVIPCYAASAIAEMACVYLSATTAERITVENSAAQGDSVGVALRAATAAGDMIPVAFSGVVKMTAQGTIALSEVVVSNAADSSAIVNYEADPTTTDGNWQWNGGTVEALGIALQAAGTTGDEILVLLTPM